MPASGVSACFLKKKRRLMKKIYNTLLFLLASMTTLAQGWPAQYGGVMLQGFYWDSYDASQWTKLEAQADELARHFDLIWIPQSGNCGGQSMGYDDLYWFPGEGRYNSSFGTEAELRSMIKTFKEKGLKTLADVVVNHRRNVSNWVDFPRETYKGVTYELKSTDICANDDGGATATWATANGYSLSANNDSGEGWDGMRDLDHNSENVQNNVKAYLKMLLDDLGYAGFRYDMVKGYKGEFTGMYNAYAQPEFSVGEYWVTDVAGVTNWINATKIDNERQSAAFDFPFRYTVSNAINNNDWTKLQTSSLASAADTRRYAITFVENHDTEKRSNADQDPIKRDTLAANAWLLAFPGTPCVFFKHWLDCKRDIAAMIAVRKAVGIINESSATAIANQKTAARYIATVRGNNGYLMVAIGKDAGSYTNSSYVKVLEGYHYAYSMRKAMETAWADAASGEYDKTLSVMLTAVTASTGAKLVYTLDGSTPTASSTTVASGTKITIGEGTTVLKVGMLIDGAVKGIVTREYTVKPFVPYDITVYVNTDKVGWTSCNFWTWGGDGSHSPKNTTWPGDKVTDTKTLGGRKWFHHQYRINNANDAVSFVFSTGSGTPQTVNVEGITQDAYLEISTEKDGDNYKVVALSDIPTVQTGDVNGDGSINVKDAVMIVDYLLGKAPENFNEAAADMNGNGKTDVSDIVNLILLITHN